jgi:ATP-dependent DNA ligase
MDLELSLEPMESRAVDEIPKGDNWQYEPKWDGFRCLAFRDGTKVELQSKSGQALGRYFPELVEALSALKAKQFVLDGEIVIPDGEGGLSFDKLLQRVHPAASRVKKLSVETPCVYIVFDLLTDGKGKSLTEKPLEKRRSMLEDFVAKNGDAGGTIQISPATRDYATAQRWFGAAGAATDGIMAKLLDEPYDSGTREGMVKVKPIRTADCVVGGFRYAAKGKIVGSLLLGLYDDKGLLNHIGFCSGMTDAMRREITPKLEKLIKAPGFTGSAPGGPSRWSNGRSAEWQPLKPELVVEVGWSHFTGGRFRHGTKFLRWRPDKSPRQCKIEQVASPEAGALGLLHKE